MDVVRCERQTAIDLSLASTYVPLCRVVLKTALVVAMVAYGCDAGTPTRRCTYTLHIYFALVCVDSVLSVERIINSNAVALFIFQYVFTHIVLWQPVGVASAAYTIVSVAFAVVSVSSLVVNYEPRLMPAVSGDVVRRVFKVFCVGMLGLECFARHAGLSPLEIVIPRDVLLHIVLFGLLVLLWVYVVDVRLCDYRLRLGLDVHYYLCYVLYVPVWVVLVSVVALVAYVASRFPDDASCAARPLDCAPAAAARGSPRGLRQPAAASAKDVLPVVVVDSQNEDIDLLAMAKAGMAYPR